MIFRVRQKKQYTIFCLKIKKKMLRNILKLSFLIIIITVFQLFAGTGVAFNAQTLNLTQMTTGKPKPRCPVRWSWGPWSDCDPVTCTRYRRRRCELPMTCSREVCMDKAFARQRAVVRRYRPCSLRDTVNICNKKASTVSRQWGSTPFVSFGSGSRFSAFQKPSRLWRQLTPIYLEEPLMNPAKRSRRKGSIFSVRTGGSYKADDVEVGFKDYPTKIQPISTAHEEKEHGNNNSSPTTSTSPPFSAFFGQWSLWSACEFIDSSTSNYRPIIICAQMRTRVCSVASICGDYVLLHRRRCRSSLCHNQSNVTTRAPPLTVSEKPTTPVIALSAGQNVNNYGEIGDDDTKSSYQHQIRQLDAAVIPSTMASDSSSMSQQQSGSFQTNKQQCGVSELLSYATNKSPRIIGGRLVPRGKWPWMVVLVNRRGEQFCGGALIANQWVLTAAHCLDRVAAIRIGEHSLDRYDPGEVTTRPAAIFAHPNYNPDDFDSDIGLILLDRPLNYSKFIIPACIPPPERERAPSGTPEVGGGLRAGTMCTVVGWGKLAEHYPTGSARPREVRVPIVSRQACRKAYADQLTSTQICAGYLQGGRDSCGGDSGGPLMCQEQITITERFPNNKGEPQVASRVVFRWVVEGLVSHGDGCGLQMKYGVYTRVDAFVDWVNAIVNRPEAFLGKFV